MSVIAAIKCGKTGSVWVGSDTMMSSASLRQTVGPKWVLHAPWAVGVAGHLRSLNLFRHRAVDLLGNLSGPIEFAGRARELLKADGFTNEGNGGGPLVYGQMLILAHARDLWTVAGDFSVVEQPVGRLWAEGSGRELAIGAAHALRVTTPDMKARDVVRHAVDAAIAYETSCGGTAWVEKVAGA